jgi:hypothetical protein
VDGGGTTRDGDPMGKLYALLLGNRKSRGGEKRASPAPREKRPGENESAHDAKKENGPRTRDLVMGCGRLRPD